MGTVFLCPDSGRVASTWDFSMFMCAQMLLHAVACIDCTKHRNKICNETRKLTVGESSHAAPRGRICVSSRPDLTLDQLSGIPTPNWAWCCTCWTEPFWQTSWAWCCTCWTEPFWQTSWVWCCTCWTEPFWQTSSVWCCTCWTEPFLILTD